MFDSCASARPDRLAAVDARSSWTYGDVMAVSEGVSIRLRERGLSAGSAVAIHATRCAALAPAIIGSWKAGAAVLILDANHPGLRLRSLVETVRPQAFLQLDESAPVPGDLLGIDGQGSRGKPVVTLSYNPAAARTDLPAPSLPAPRSCRGAEDVAYFIFTSGTTGHPKGIATPHCALPHFLKWYERAFRSQEADRFSMLSGLGHDPLMRDLFVPLTVGATLYVPSPEQLRDGAALLSWMSAHRITVCHITPSIARLLTSARRAFGAEDLGCLRLAMFGGEPLRFSDVRSFRGLAAGATVVNCYGASETPQIMGYYCVPPNLDIPETGAVPVGNGIDDAQLLVMNGEDIAPDNQTGEICIRTRYLSLGYVSDAEKTRSRFLDNPYLPQVPGIPRDRIYRTGDLGIFTQGVGVQFAGRVDTQVKVRGFRVELEEIEGALRLCAHVSDAVVLHLKEGDDDTLVAFVLATDGFHEAECKRELKPRLLPHMIPARILRRSSPFPLNANGKLDRKALLADAVRERGPEPSVSPVHARSLEEQICEVFCHVLHLARVDASNDFFDLGGHSLNAVTLISSLNERFGVSLPLHVLFTARSPRALAGVVRDGGNGAEPPSSDALLEIQSSGTALPLFCVARPNRNALGFLFLARRLGTGQPVYGLQKQLPEEADLDFAESQYAQAASDYILDMKRVQPKGPYRIVAYCQGAYIALEMVRQLEAAGDAVQFLGVIDTWRDENTRSKPLFLLERYWSALRTKKPREILARLLRWAGDNEAGPAGMNRGNRTNHGMTSGQMWQRYFPDKHFVPPQVSSRIVVFRVAKQPFFRKPDPSLGWSRWSSQPVDATTVAGDHYTVLREPHVASLADAVRTHLDAPPASAGFGRD